MKNLIIIGARGFGREVSNWARQCKGYSTEWRLKGFLDDDSEALYGFNYDLPILDSVEDYIVQNEDVFFCALGDIDAKKKYVSIIREKGGRFINLLHNAAIICDNVEMGEGILICAFCGISNEVSIGDFVTIQGYTSIGHDCEIGSWSNLHAFTSMGGYAKLEEEVTIFPKGSVLPKVVIGKGSTVGAGSVVLKSVPPGVTVFGIPAKTIF